MISLGFALAGDCCCLSDDCGDEDDDEGLCNWGKKLRLLGGCFREKDICLCKEEEDEVAEAIVRSLYKRHLIRERRAARVIS